MTDAPTVPSGGFVAYIFATNGASSVISQPIINYPAFPTGTTAGVS